MNTNDGDRGWGLIHLTDVCCAAYTKCVATLWHDRIYLFIHESQGPVSHTATHVRAADLFSHQDRDQGYTACSVGWLRCNSLQQTDFGTCEFARYFQSHRKPSILTKRTTSSSLRGLAIKHTRQTLLNNNSPVHHRKYYKKIHFEKYLKMTTPQKTTDQ